MALTEDAASRGGVVDEELKVCGVLIESDWFERVSMGTRD